MIDFSSSPLFLAPMAGFSDIALRGVVKKFGCDVTISEMISANALVFEGKKSLNLLEKNAFESPYIVQIAGSDAEIIKKAVEILNEIDGIDGIDLNCGCPVPKVVRQNAGSALLKEPENLYKILETIKKTSNKTYTSIKIRLGFDEKDAYKIAGNFENCGVDFICVHGRTRAGGYHAKVDYDAIRAIKEAAKIPVIANGNIDEQNIDEVLEITGCAGAMIGRAVVGRPWIFEQIKEKRKIAAFSAGGEVLATKKSNLEPNSSNLSPNLTFNPQNPASQAAFELKNDFKKLVILEHLDQMISHYKEHGVAIFRKHLHEYSKGLNGASSFRNEINLINNETDLRAAIERFFV